MFFFLMFGRVGTFFDLQSTVLEDNERLNNELREARATIRNLELQVEGLKANAQRAKALLENQ